MNVKAGIRREDKNIWEQRVPITPQHLSELMEEAGISFCVQPSAIRAFPDSDYRAAGAEIAEDLSSCPVVFAVKEIPLECIQPSSTYLFFAHVIKGQESNMPMLQRLLDLGCTLIDYERVTDEKGRRLIFFGRHAGLAGMIDTLWALGQRLEWEGRSTPFSQLKQAYHYGSSTAAKEAVRRVGEEIAEQGLQHPLVCGIAGYGNVSRGAQEVLDQLPVQEIAPEQLVTLAEGEYDRHKVGKVVFHEVHTVKPVDPAQGFDLQDFFEHPAKYESQFERYIPHLTVLVNAIYWTPASPRLVTKAYLRQSYGRSQAPRLKIIGDISCDIEGAIEATVRATDPGEPVYVYEPATGRAPAGIAGEGPVIMAVDNLPCEFAAEASADFSAALRDHVPAIVTADYGVPLSDCRLPPEIKRAVIAYRGQLTPDYRCLEQFLGQR